MESYYDTLGVSPTADAAQLRRAYRRAARTAHPDTGGSTEAFQAVQAAWNTLSDPERRGRYDARSGQGKPPKAAAPRAAPAPPTQPTSPAATTAAEPATTERSSPAVTARRQPNWASTGLVIGLAGAGGLTWLIVADLGRGFAIAGALYLVAVLGLLLARSRGLTTGERTLELLTRAAWVLAAGFAVLGLTSWSTGRSPWAGLLWALCVALFAASATVLGRRTGPSI